MTGEDQGLYDKISLLANGENEAKQVRLNHNDTFILGVSPSDNNEVIATSTIDELYRAGCFVKYIKKNQKNKNNLVVCVPSVMLAEFAKQSKKVVEKINLYYMYFKFFGTSFYKVLFL